MKFAEIIREKSFLFPLFRFHHNVSECYHRKCLIINIRTQSRKKCKQKTAQLCDWVRVCRQRHLIAKRNSRFIIAVMVYLFHNFMNIYSLHKSNAKSCKYSLYVRGRETIIIIVAPSLYLISSSKTSWCRLVYHLLSFENEFHFFSFRFNIKILMMTHLQLNRHAITQKTPDISFFHKIFVLFFIYHKVKFIISQ